MPRFALSLFLVALLGANRPAHAADPTSAPASSNPGTTNATTASAPAEAPVGTDPSYRLATGDTIGFSVFNEPDLTATQTISHSGEVRLPLIGDIALSGKSVRDAERAVEAAFRDRQYLKDPVVNLTVVAYFPREVSVLGAVRSPGTFSFPRDVTSLDIVEVITKVGGFLPISKSDAVTVTHRGADGKETVTTVDLEDVISGRHQRGRDRADIAIYPGDRIWVPERLF